jgi:Fe-S cluster biogenesis protein NfuA
MFIQTEATDQTDRMKFLPGRDVLDAGVVEFRDAGQADHSPLAMRLFANADVRAVELGADYISVTKAPEADWNVLRTQILQVVMAHFTAGEPVLLEGEGAQADGMVADDDADPAVVAEIRELIETRIRPTAAQGGGDVTYRGYKDGIVLLEFSGPAFGLLAGITNMLQHYIPEVKGAADYRDALPKPGLETPEGVAIQELLDTRINPTVAMHGGHIALVDVLDDTVYIRLEGGCQGCGMADVTLKQGIVVQIQETVPAIAKVLDVTDHASGSNPYYQPGK